jgi:hypothetical protein
MAGGGDDIDDFALDEDFDADIILAEKIEIKQ